MGMKMFLKLPKFKISYFKMSLFEHVDKRKYKLLHAAKIKKTFFDFKLQRYFWEFVFAIASFFFLCTLFSRISLIYDTYFCFYSFL